MKTLSFALLVIFSQFSCAHIKKKEKVSVNLSQDVFKDVPFSSQFSEDGALIRNVDFESVNALIPQLEEKFQHILRGRKLEDRGEAHITVITPPEGKTGFFPGSIGLDKDGILPNSEILSLYRDSIQETKFNIECVGMQQNERGNVVFYLVVESPDIINIRTEIDKIASTRDATIPFEPVGQMGKRYSPHITIGFVGGDVHGVEKRSESCVADISYY